MMMEPVTIAVGKRAAEFVLTALLVAIFVTGGESAVCWWMTRDRT
jgi:hypothetical protein